MNPPLPLERPRVTVIFRGVPMEIEYLATNDVLAWFFVADRTLHLECAADESAMITRACTDANYARQARGNSAAISRRLRMVPLARDAGGAA